jgi:TatD DNase family protein
MKYIDIHSHLNFPKFQKDLDKVLARMYEAGIGTISVGVDNKTSEEVVDIASKNKNIWACIGIHPDSASSEDDSDKDSKDPARTDVSQGGGFDGSLFEELVKNPKVVCIGECGLDYFRLGENNPRINANEKETQNNAEEKIRQRKLFEKQIDFAVHHDLPLMLHVRPSKGTQDAHLDVFKILEYKKEEYGDKLRGNSHFFASTREIAERYINLGFTISFTGLITYVRDFDEIIKSTPLEKMHIETDAPFVAPVPHRGERNEPTYVVEVAKKIAEIRGIEESELYPHLLKNSSVFFNLGLD